MILDNPNLNLFAFQNIQILFKGAYIILSALYFLFALIVVRQVALMTDTVVTEIGPFLRTLSIIHAIFALGIVILLIIAF
jgi:hypothetical protein